MTAVIANGMFLRTNNLPHSHDDNHQEVVNYLMAYERLRTLIKTDRRPVRIFYPMVVLEIQNSSKEPLMVN